MVKNKKSTTFISPVQAAAAVLEGRIVSWFIWRFFTDFEAR